jgi:alkylation response protein AidB-like acyl-CoA dehydrogenase
VDLLFDDSETAYRRIVRQFCDDVLQPIADEWGYRQSLSRAEIQKVAQRLERYEIATTAPLTEGGEPDLMYLCMFIEEISRIDVGFASLANAIFFQVWDMAALLSTDEQKARYGHLFDRGEMVAIAMSEPEAASRPKDLRTSARRTESGWTLNGHKVWISHAAVATGIVVMARKIEGDHEGDISLFMVGDEAGCEVTTIETLGMDASTLCDVKLTNVKLPLDAELTPGSGGLRRGLSLVEQARFKVIFMAVGLAQASLEKAVAYSKERALNGRPIASFQLVQQLLAEMSTLTECARLLDYRAVSLVKAGHGARAAISRAKAYPTEAAVKVTSMGIQVHGAMGLTREVGAEKFFRDACMLTIPDGTTEIHQLVIGRELTGISAFA